METFTDDTVVALASFLSPHDMLSLALTCKRFGDKHGMDKKQSAARGENTRNVKQKTENKSLMEVAARTVLLSILTDEEKNALRKSENKSWIGLYQEFLKLFRLPLQFDKLVGECIAYDESTDKTKVNEITKVGVQSTYNTAICNNIMRAGKHRVSFNIDNPSANNVGITCGIMRPTTKDIRSLKECHPVHDDLSKYSLKDYETLYGDYNVDCYLLNTYFGNGKIRERWKQWTPSEMMAMLGNENELRRNECKLLDWEGLEETKEASFKIGLELDLDEGTLNVYKNDRRLGTMTDELIGEYCWVVSFHADGFSLGSEASVSICR